jgi:hypothetical protein
MTSESLPRRVTRLENDTVAIYEILTDIQRKQATHDRRFDQVDARFQQVDARFQQVEVKLDEVLRRLPGNA